MKKIAMFLTLALLLGCQQQADITTVTGAVDKEALKTDVDKVSYSIGLDIGSKLKNQEIEVDLLALAKGLQDGLAGEAATPLLSSDEINETMMAFQKSMNEKIMAKRKAEADQALAAGEQFLADNKAKEGVVTTDSGLQYKIITEGTGPIPTAEDKVQCHYTGKFIDGTVFDSSVQRGEPATFPVAGVIPGWTEALQLMKTGSKWELVIPAKLAYGERGAGDRIPANAVLVFEVELLNIVGTTDNPVAEAAK